MNTTHNIRQLETPFYYYDLDLLERTLYTAITEASKYGYHLHYAVKANSNPKILSIIKNQEIGADCVSGNEIRQALASGFMPDKIVFAGVGKTDSDILYAIQQKIACFNCESLQEIQVINSIAKNESVIVNIAIRINPDINANTHSYISTGMSENKFGISQNELIQFINQFESLSNINLTGLHFHIGSQICDLQVFENLCKAANNFIEWFNEQHISLSHINLGGGLGIEYQDPDSNPIPPFGEYFKIINKNLRVHDHMQVHFEPGRSIVGQCGNLFTRVLYLKDSENKKFVIVDAGLTELIRPALYQSYHKIENIDSDKGNVMVDIVGPICESSDYFAKNTRFPETRRGDLLKIHSTGAYGESMSSNYNSRSKVRACYSDGSTNIDDSEMEKAS